MKQVGLYEAKTKLSALVAELEKNGKSIALTKHGKIVAELTLPSAVAGPKAGMLKSAGFFIAADFDEDASGFEDFFTDSTAADLPPRLSKIAEHPTSYPAEQPGS